MYRLELRIADRTFYSEEISSYRTAMDLVTQVDLIPGVGERLVSLQKKAENGWDVV